VTLAFAPSQLPIPAYPATPPTPPRALGPGESLAWAFAATHSPPGIVFRSNPFGFSDVSGTTTSTQVTGDLILNNGWPFPPNSVAADWGGFVRPLAIPMGAKITGIYPVVNVSTLLAGGNIEIGDSINGNFGPPGLGPNYGANAGTFDLEIMASILNTVENTGTVTLELSPDFVGLAVYYLGSPLTETSLVYEALNDVRLGAPAKIWFGFLKPDGTLAGVPYLIFKGSVDQPSVKLDPLGSSIALALESRMVNLQRASNRKYTSADQHLDYPNDMGFSWQEILQEISLKQGS